MMPCCAVAGCSNHTRHSKETGISFHRFPKEKILRKQWMQICKRKDNFIVDNKRICSVHFEEKDFERDLRAELLHLKAKRILKHSAVPKIKTFLAPGNSNNIGKRRRKRAEVQNTKKERNLLLNVNNKNEKDESSIDLIFSTSDSETNQFSQISPLEVELNELKDENEYLKKLNKQILRKLENTKSENSQLREILKQYETFLTMQQKKFLKSEINQLGDKLLICKGGRGGGPDNEFIGEKGQHLPLILDLKLLADVGFVGFPNAGKSTLLTALSSAKPKIASYPFTTIQPTVGTLSYPDFRTITAADLPGLIEGSHLNRGMGHKFLKHCLRTQVLLFVVDINGFRLSPKFPHRNAVETILYLNRELELYNEELVNKPAILVINKCDTDEDGTKFEAIKDCLQILKVYASNLELEMKPDKLIKFDAVLPISALKGTNIPVLKDKIRTLLDIYNEEKEQKQKQVIVCTNPEYDVIYV